MSRMLERLWTNMSDYTVLFCANETSYSQLTNSACNEAIQCVHPLGLRLLLALLSSASMHP